MRKSLLCVICLMLMCMIGVASAAPTLPDTGVDVGSYVTVLVTSLGAIIATVIGATFAIFVIRRAISWVKGYVR